MTAKVSPGQQGFFAITHDAVIVAKDTTHLRTLPVNPLHSESDRMRLEH
jgi:hypothetical protein